MFFLTLIKWFTFGNSVVEEQEYKGIKIKKKAKNNTSDWIPTLWIDSFGKIDNLEDKNNCAKSSRLYDENLLWVEISIIFNLGYFAMVVNQKK